MKKRIILGSGSPRRKELLEQIGVNFEVRVSEKEEQYKSVVPEEIVKELSLMKAENVAEEMVSDKENGGQLRNMAVIGADTIVALDDEILGKPRDEEDAAHMLTRLQGREHYVYTGVAVLDFDAHGKKNVISYSVGTKVYVNEMTEEEIRAYIATGEPADKAGAYGIQGGFAAYIGRIDGDYYNVVGLPVSRVYRTLREIV
nr:Maf family protein [uncultured Mediterraneibacter sp.]